jgi:hypothetical protein
VFKKTDVHKLLFLDIDGVLNYSSYFKADEFKENKKKLYDSKKLDLLKEIVDKTNCTIVMSSSWRTFYFKRKNIDKIYNLKNDLKNRGIIIKYKIGNEYNSELLKLYSGGFSWIEDDKGFYSTEYNKIEKQPITEFYERGLQIKIFKENWEHKYGKINFAILDDDDGDLHLFGENFVRTNWYGENEEDCGLTKEAVNKCVDLLNKKFY